jgi:hypothetical protein
MEGHGWRVGVLVVLALAAMALVGLAMIVK